jgi:PST family polysaccharide transporter
MNRKIIENATALYVVQALNYILPLITLPYLTRILGTDKYGLLLFANALIQYFVTITDYGFNISATRSISIWRDNGDKISEIFSAVYIIKLILASTCLLVLSLLIFFVGRFRSDPYLYLISYLAVIGNLLFPVWYFQGLERMKEMAILNVVARVLTTAALFMYVRFKGDYLLAALIQNLGVVVSGGVSLMLVRKIYPVRIVLPSMKTLKGMIKEGWSIFVSLISVAVIGNTTLIMLGFLTNNTYVGYFAISQKIVWAFCNLIPPIANAIFPKVSQLFKLSTTQGVEFLKKVVKYITPLFAMLTLILWLSAPRLVLLVTGDSEAEIIRLVRIMAIIPLLIFTDNIYGMQIMLNKKLDNQFMNIYVVGGVLTIILSGILVPKYMAIGTAISLLLTEIIMLISMYIVVRNHGIKLFRWI